MQVNFDPLAQRYASQRFPLYARGGMVNCSSPQAAAAGLEALRRGGNAMDAAVAAAATLTVTEPTANGLGSDAFALVWSEKEGRLFGLNASGPAPMLADADKVLALGRDEKGKMPRHGWTPVTVPGAVGAWAALTERFGRRSLAQNLAEAVRYAREGYPCAPNLAAGWQSAFAAYRKLLTEPCFDAWFQTFALEGRAPEAGELIRLPDHADTLEEIGATGGESFYRGELAKKIDAESRKFGGFLRFEDLAAYRPLWVEPIRLNYRGFEVCEIPPNGQGIVALMALNILKEFDFPQRDCAMTAHRQRDCAMTAHRQIEALKMAFADAFRTVTDPKDMELDYHRLLLPEYGAQRAREMTDTGSCGRNTAPCGPGR